MKINYKVLIGILMAIGTGISATFQAISDQRKTEKMDELIEQVDKLTKHH